MASQVRIKVFNMQRRGFTLVELLVVIGIIALVMIAVFPNFSGARQRARDSQRKSDLKDIQAALDLYKSDQKPLSYVPSPTFPILCGKCWSSDNTCGNPSSGNISNIYTKKFPCDPGGLTTPTPYVYILNAGDNLKYTLTACLENPVDPDRDPTPATGCTTSYTVTEP